jgi:NodT family efflux transporter outer membrane factor (OMF) lipoprotein
MTSTSLVLLFSLALGAGGCAVRTAPAALPQAPPSMPDNWQQSAQGVVTTASDLSRWWEQLGDTTLNDLIEQALAGSPDLRTAQARLRQARSERGIAASTLKPVVSAGAAVSDGRARPLAFSPGFDASWEPDVFGGARAAVNAATADTDATLADLYATQVSLVAEVALNYGDLRTTQQRLEIARSNEASQSETLDLTTFRAQAGLVSSVDVEQARSNLEQTRSQTPSFESAIAQQIHRLGTLTGQAPEALTSRLSEIAALPQVPETVAVGIPADTLRQRPDVRAAEQRVVASTARVLSAQAARYPQFSLSGSIGLEILTGALTGGTTAIATAAGAVAQTLFDGGRIRQQIAVQNAVQEQSVAAYEGTVLRALEDVENALVEFEKSRERLASLDRAVEASQNAALLAESLYTAGLADFQRVLDTQRSVRTLEDSVALTKGDRVAALIQLFKALGGGWSSAADSAVTGSIAS